MIPWPFATPAPVVGPAGTADAPACAVIHAAGFERGWDTAEFERLIADRGVAAHVVRPGGKGRPCGFVLSRIAADEAEILTIAIDPKARGKGIGRLLLDRHMSLVAGRGAGRLFLEVAEDNTAAVKLYVRAGFSVVGKRAGYYARRGQAPATALVMARPL